MSEEEVMVKDIVIQLLNSPDWQNQSQCFAFDNCIYFDSEIDNSMNHQVIYQSYQKTMAIIYDSYVQSLGMDDDELDRIQAIVIDQLIREGNKVVGSLKAVMDFNVFKAEMQRWNKSLDLQAYQQMMGDDEDEDEDDEGQDEQDEGQDEEQDEGQDKFNELELQEQDLEQQLQQEDLNLQIALLMSLGQDEDVNNQISDLRVKKEELEQKRLPQLSLQKQGNNIDSLGFTNNIDQFECPPIPNSQQVASKKQQATDQRIILKFKDQPQEELKKRKELAQLIKNIKHE